MPAADRGETHPTFGLMPDRRGLRYRVIETGNLSPDRASAPRAISNANLLRYTARVDVQRRGAGRPQVDFGGISIG